MRKLLISEINCIHGGVLNTGRGYVSSVATETAPDPAASIAKAAGSLATAGCSKTTDGVLGVAACSMLGGAVESGVDFLLEGPPSTSQEAYATACAKAGGASCTLMNNAGSTAGGK